MSKPRAKRLSVPIGLGPIRPTITAILLAACAAWALAACSPGIRVAPPFQLVETTGAYKKAPLSAALVRPGRLVRPGTGIGEELAPQMDDALVTGLADATRALVDRVVVLDRRPAAGYDLIVLPGNFYHDAGNDRAVTLSLDVTLVRGRDGNESGILVEGVGSPGPRAVVRWEREGHELHLTGARLSNPAYGQALNNAMFDLTLDYARKLDKRLDGFR